MKLYPFIIAIAVISVVLKELKPFIHGKLGEASVRTLLDRLPKDKYTVLNDVMLRTERGTSQIDHVVVSVYGVFVIETKNYSGWILGSENADEWTKNVYGKKFRFRNPLKQNYGHVKALEKALELPSSCFIPIVVFSMRATLKVKTSQPVVYTVKLLRTIQSYSQTMLSDDDVQRVVAVLKQQNISTKENNREHIKEIRENVRTAEEKLKNGICPKCGGKLLIRSGKYGKFYGCGNYPKCRYTKQL